MSGRMNPLTAVPRQGNIGSLAATPQLLRARAEHARRTLPRDALTAIRERGDSATWLRWQRRSGSRS